MSRRRFVLLAAAALLIISAALFFSNRRGTGVQQPGTLLFPALPAQLAALTSVVILKGSSTTTLHKTGDRWTVAERADYPADLDRLHQLLTSARDATLVEEKTSDPTRYAEIGVEDPAQPGATGTQITLTAKAAASFSFIVGKTMGEDSFVRRSGEKASFSVEPAISLEIEPKFWIDSRLIDRSAMLIQGMEFHTAAGAAYALKRVAPAPAAAPAGIAVSAFTLDGIPKGRAALDAAALAPSPNTLTALEAQDVSSLDGLDFSKASRTIVTFTDGSALTLTGIVIDTRHYIQLSSSNDAALNDRGSGRAFEIASYRYDPLFKPLDQLLVPAAHAP